jgi:DNA-binding response OmpR family regulator
MDDRPLSVTGVAIVLIIEDNTEIRSGLKRSLGERGYDVRTSPTGLGGLSIIVDEHPDVVLLDLGLPDIDGVDLLRMLRAVSKVPVVVVTARDDEAEIIRTLDTGADDYIVKPFSTRQLEARLRAVLRRTTEESGGVAIVVGALRVDPATREASIEDRNLRLTRKEFDMLYFLAVRAGRVVSKRQLLAEVWDQPYGGSDKTVDVHLSWLRRKLGESATEPRYVRTVHGVGVRLVDPEAGGDDGLAPE